RAAPRASSLRSVERAGAALRLGVLRDGVAGRAAGRALSRGAYREDGNSRVPDRLVVAAGVVRDSPRGVARLAGGVARLAGVAVRVAGVVGRAAPVAGVAVRAAGVARRSAAVRTGSGFGVVRAVPTTCTRRDGCFVAAGVALRRSSSVRIGRPWLRSIVSRR